MSTMSVTKAPFLRSSTHNRSMYTPQYIELYTEIGLALGVYGLGFASTALASAATIGILEKLRSYLWEIDSSYGLSSSADRQDP